VHGWGVSVEDVKHKNAKAGRRRSCRLQGSRIVRRRIDSAVWECVVAVVHVWIIAKFVRRRPLQGSRSVEVVAGNGCDERPKSKHIDSCVHFSFAKIQSLAKGRDLAGFIEDG